MQEMNTNFIFSNEIFKINPDVYFTVDTTVIHGHRVCKLKSLKIHYHGETFKMLSGETIHTYFIKKGLQSIYSIELINHLNKLVNYENLYEVYSSDSIIENSSLNSSAAWACRRDIQDNLSSFIIHDESNEINSKRYKNNLIQNSLFIKSELDKTRNLNYPICYSNYEEIKNIPIFCYVHPSLATNQGNTVILCHIGYILEKLANYKRFPEFNTQAVISFMNVVNESIRTDNTVEKVNLVNLEIEMEKLKKKYLKKKEKCKSLKTKVDEIKDLQIDVNNKSEIIINQNNEIKDLQIDLNHKSLIIQKSISSLNKTAQEAIKFKQASDQYAIDKLSDNKISTGNTDERFILLFRSDLNNNYHIANPKEPKEIIVLDTISCQKENREKLLYIDHNYDEKTCKIIYETSMGNALDFNRFVKNNAEIIQPIINSKENPKQIRKYRIHVSNLKFLISELEKINVDSKVARDEIINNNHAFMENIYNPIEDVYELLKESETDHVDDLKDILMIMNKEIKNIKIIMKL